MLEELRAMVPAELGTIENYSESEGKVRFTLTLLRPAEAMAKSVKRALETRLEECGFESFIVVKEPHKAEKPKIKRQGGMENVARVIAVASGKGGVGKSSVAAAIARSLASAGIRVGVLDADIYGPSQPKLFAVEGYQPAACQDNENMMEPAVTATGIKLMSIGFFVGADQALAWRGPMATSALKQMIDQTAWGEIDILVVDLPPGTGDIHLTVASELKIDGAIIVTTPSDLALADVVRGIALFRAKNVEVPILGVINNMAYFAPSDMLDKRYYIFGTDDNLKALAAQYHIPILASIPITEHYGAPLSIDTSAFIN